ncbi:hypothetical protein JXO52_00215 [bacterium]|nr:hypothetical protein [bacterium]
MRFLTLFLLCLIVFPAKSNSQTNAETRAAVVNNRGIPACPEAALHLTFVREVDPSFAFSGRPDLVRTDSAGTLYAARHSFGSIARWRQGGRIQETVGERGEAGGRYRYINDVCPRPDGVLVVLDSYASRTLLFPGRGNGAAAVPWNLSFEHYLGRVLMANDSLFVALKKETTVGKPRTLSAEVVAYDYRGNPVWSIPGLADGELAVERVSDTESRVAMRAHAPAAAVCADPGTGEIHIIDGNRYRIRTYSADGRLIRVSGRPYERVRVRDADGLKGGGAEGAGEPCDVRNVAAGCLTDDEHRLWVRTNEQRDDATAYDVFDGRGVYCCRFWMTLHPAAFSAGILYTVNDTNSIGMYRYTIAY